MSAYRHTLDFLYSRLPMYQRIGNPAFKKGLGNTLALLHALGDPHLEIPTIHIAGTNGKGTVAHMLAACLTAAGHKTGLYVSPHYVDFRERMKIDGSLIAKSDVVEIVERMKPAIEAVSPSFFEMTVAMAFEAFRMHNVDIAVIETGLGGRLDSTNVIKPLVSVITNISFDHMQMLGTTLPAIAREKAGIIKKKTPVVIGEYQKEVARVFKKTADQRKATIAFASRRLKAVIRKDSLTEHVVDILNTKGEMQFKNLTLGSGGPFQSANLITALYTMKVLGQHSGHFRLAEDEIRRGFRNIKTLSGYQGRWHVLGKQPLILCDSGHNAGGLEITMRYLDKLPHRDKHFVIGFVRDKDLDEILSLLPPMAHYYFCRPGIPRGLDADALHAEAELYGLHGKEYKSVRAALAAAKRRAGKEDLIFIGGSTFVVAEVLART